MQCRHDASSKQLDRTQHFIERQIAEAELSDDIVGAGLLYLAGQKAEAAALVPAELLEATSLCGPESYIKERVAGLAEAGVTHLNVTPVGADPVAMIEKLRSWV